MWFHARRTTLISLCIMLQVAKPAWAQKIAVVTSPLAAPLSKAQLAQIYLGRSFERRPIDLPDSNPLRASFYRAAADSDQTQVRTAWARVMFTGRGEPPRELPSTSAVKKAVAADPRAVGYIEAESVDATVRAVLWLP